MPKDQRVDEPELVWLVAYIFEDEDAALELEAKHKRTSRARS